MNEGLSKKATGRDVIASVAARVEVDPAILEYLFSECLAAVVTQASEAGACTVRGLGRLRTVTVDQISGEERPTTVLTVFERTKHLNRYTPFAAQQLAMRMKYGKS